MTREFDVVLFGATGFTGALVADYLARHAAAATLRWALAGRSRDKLEAVRAALPRSGATELPIIVADARDADALSALARRTRVVCSTAGPYAIYGSGIVAACADAGTHYCDLTGEVHWMRKMIDAHDARARQTGARIVHACGFDSIPPDLGTWALQQEFIARHGRPARAVLGLYGPFKGAASGGTIASAINGAEERALDPAVAAIVDNPYALDPDPHAPRPPVPDSLGLGYDRRAGVLTAPFPMALINTRVVRRSHALAGLPWGDDFVYDERLSARPTPTGAALAFGAAALAAGTKLMLGNARLRALIEPRLPKPGEGPSAAARAAGFWVLKLFGESGADRLVYEVADRHADPGYASTAKMLGESALCLALDPLTSPGGVQTPSIAMAEPLIERLRAAGLTFAPLAPL